MARVRALLQSREKCLGSFQREMLPRPEETLWEKLRRGENSERWTSASVRCASPLWERKSPKTPVTFLSGFNLTQSPKERKRRWKMVKRMEFFWGWFFFPFCLANGIARPVSKLIIIIKKKVLWL